MDKIITGLSTFLIGIAATFLVLSLLIGFLLLFKAVFTYLEKRKGRARAAAGAGGGLPASGGGGADADGEVIAAISAALCAYYAAESTPVLKPPFKLRGYEEFKRGLRE